MKIETTKQKDRKPTEFFKAVKCDVVYKRGKEGLCISADGVVYMDYSGKDLARVFEDSENYERLYEGDVITITL